MSTTFVYSLEPVDRNDFVGLNVQAILLTDFGVCLPDTSNSMRIMRWEIGNTTGFILFILKVPMAINKDNIQIRAKRRRPREAKGQYAVRGIQLRMLYFFNLDISLYNAYYRLRCLYPKLFGLKVLPSSDSFEFGNTDYLICKYIASIKWGRLRMETRIFNHTIYL